MGQKSTNEIGPFARAVNAELRAAAARRSLSQTRLAEMTGIPQPSISKLLYREVTALTVHRLRLLCDALDLSPSAVLSAAERSMALPHPDALDLAAHLEAAGAPVEDLVYMTVDQDNREGTESSDPSSIWMTDEDGGLYTFQKTMDVLDSYAPVMEWPDDVEDPFYTLWDGTEIPEAQYDELNSASTEMYNASLDGVPAGARDTTVYVYDGSSGALPDEFTGITVEDGMGSSSVGAPAGASDMESTTQG